MLHLHELRTTINVLLPSIRHFRRFLHLPFCPSTVMFPVLSVSSFQILFVLLTQSWSDLISANEIEICFFGNLMNYLALFGFVALSWWYLFFYLCIASGGSSVPRDENPFSFRHFLSRCPAASQTIEQQHHQQQQQPRASSEDGEDWRIYGARPKTNTRTLRLHSTENEVKTPCGLPDFVTDHLGIEHELSHAAHPNSYYLPESNSSRSQLQGSVDSPLDLPRSSSPIHAAGEFIVRFSITCS